MFWVVVAVLYFVLAAVAPSILGLFVNRARPDFGTLALSLRIVFVAIALICLAATSYVHVESDEIAVLNKIYGTASLPGEHIIAINGEKGPQAGILTPGWHPWFLVNVIYQVENKKVVSIPSGQIRVFERQGRGAAAPRSVPRRRLCPGARARHARRRVFPDPWRPARAADDGPDAGELPPQHLSVGRRHQGCGRHSQGCGRRRQIQRRRRRAFRQHGGAPAQRQFLPAKAGVHQFERRGGRRRSEKGR